MRTRLMPWPLLATMACFAESDTPLGGSESDGSSSSTHDDTGASSPMTTTPTSDSTDTASSDGSEITSPGEDSTSVDPTQVDDTTTSSSETGESCPTGSKPIPLPLPVAWDGVTALMLGKPDEPAPVCPDGLQSGDVVLGEPFLGICSCNCEPECWLNLYDGDCSDDPNDIGGAVSGVCEDFDAGTLQRVSLLEGDLAADGGCAFPDPTSNVEVGGQHRVCSDVSGDACIVAPDDVSIAAPCISQGGDVPCPDDSEYSDRFLVADDADAQCPSCDSCIDAAIVACESAELTVFDGAGCTGTASPGQDVGCSASFGLSAQLDVTLTCPAPDADAPSLSGVRTFCCVP